MLELAAEKAGWGTPLPEGRFRGVAVHESFNTYVAQVAEVTVDDGGGPKVERVVCAVDCGIAVNPDMIRRRWRAASASAWARSSRRDHARAAARSQQTNFDGYQVLRIDEMPKVEVHIVPSRRAPTGVGEPGVPPIGPAVANAVFAATGKRMRILPFSRNDLRSV